MRNNANNRWIEVRSFSREHPITVHPPGSPRSMYFTSPLLSLACGRQAGIVSRLPIALAEPVLLMNTLVPVC
ncbi:MAG: hypothetical protein KDA81_10375 [Planctomycetaceae bacterium]|nr:hypothetical protein [Planctomycetaceae bacterium]